MKFSRFSVVKIPTHRRFNYEPRFYDAKREELERKVQRQQKIQQMDPQDEESMRRRYAMRQKIEDNWHLSRQRQSQRSTMRLVIILGFLVLISYLLILRFDGLSALFQMN